MAPLSPRGGCEGGPLEGVITMVRPASPGKDEFLVFNSRRKKSLRSAGVKDEVPRLNPQDHIARAKLSPMGERFLFHVLP